MMGGGRWLGRWGGVPVVPVVLCLAGVARSEDAASGVAAQVRVLSASGGVSVVTVRATPAVTIEDRTPGSKPVEDAHGPAARGKTFADEVALFLGGFTAPQRASVDVDDPLVSTVRLLPERGGTTVVVFVRQPVEYAVARADGLGDVTIRVEGQVKPVVFAGLTSRGKPRYVRPQKEATSEVSVDAASVQYEREGDVLVARGGVTLTRGNMMLAADEVRYDKRTSTVDARGHVVLSDADATVEGDAAHLNLEDEVGWIDAADADMHRSDYRLQCGRLVKRGGPLYSVSDGLFTTCGCGGIEKPSWSIKAGQADVELDGSGEVHDATFRVQDIPVFYLPYFVFPANTDRETGLLTPAVGNSNRKGFWFTQPFYWAIDKSQDLTAAVDYESKARVGMLADYRYRLSRGSGGHFDTAYFNESIGGITRGTKTGTGTFADPPENRFAVQGHHLQRVDEKTRLFLDMLAVSDDTFLKDITNFPLTGQHNQFLRFTTNRIGGIRTWDDGYLRTDTSYYQDLEGQQNITLQQAPRVDMTHGISFGDRLFARMNGQVETFQRTEGFDGLRGDVSPELLLPFHLGSYVSGSVSALGHETGYHLTDTERVALFENTQKLNVVSDTVLPALEHNRNRAVGEFRGRVGTEVARVFDFPHLGLEKVRHSIEPEVRYLFVPDIGNQRATGRAASPTSTDFNATTRVVSSGTVFDEFDAISRRNFVTYGVTSRLFGRPAAGTPIRPEPAIASDDPDDSGEDSPTDDLLDAGGEQDVAEAAPERLPKLPAARELVRVSLLHGYDFSRDISPHSHASDLDLGLRLSPTDYLALAYNTTVDVQGHGFVGQQVGVSLRDPWWTPSPRVLQNPTSVAVSYNFVAPTEKRGLTTSEEQLFGPGGEVSEIAGLAYLALGQYLGVYFRGRYTFADDAASGTTPTIGPHFLERSYFVRLLSRCNCWMLDVGYSDQFNPDDRSLRVQFTLVGLGSYGKGGGGGVPLVGVAPGAFPMFGRHGGFY